MGRDQLEVQLVDRHPIATAQGFTLVTTDAAFRQFASLDLVVLSGGAEMQ